MSLTARDAVLISFFCLRKDPHPVLYYFSKPRILNSKNKSAIIISKEGLSC